MSKYSAPPALATEHPQRDDSKSTCSNSTSYGHQRRFNGVLSNADSSGSSRSSLFGPTAKLKSQTRQTKNHSETKLPKAKADADAKGIESEFIDTLTPTTEVLSLREISVKKTLPDRTYFDFENDEIDIDYKKEELINNTKDCVDCVSSTASPAHKLSALTFDKADHLQRRFGNGHRYEHFQDENNRNSLSINSNLSRQNFNQHLTNKSDLCPEVDCHTISDGCISGQSSVLSSPAPSTVSSPLSTPTRNLPQTPKNDQNSGNKLTGNISLTTTNSTHLQNNQQQQKHHHHHLHYHPHNLYCLHTHPSTSSAVGCGKGGTKGEISGNTGGCKKMQKFDTRLGPSRYRQLLPIALCILSFATVFSILIVYMDTTEITHKQFRLNMSRDYEMYGVAQDNPALIAFLREIHMRKYPMHFVEKRDLANDSSDPYLNFGSLSNGLVPEMAHYVADLVGGKKNGAVIQSLPGMLAESITAPWLSETLDWAGIIVEPEPKRYFALRQQTAHNSRMQVVHACVSPNKYPKEVTINHAGIHNEEAEVQIDSMLDEETSWFNSRVKCFPLYTIMLACNRVEYDLLSLGVHGHELEILETLPFDKIKIDIISIHLLSSEVQDDKRQYIKAITKFLMEKSYKLQKSFGHNYFYQRVNSTSRTRKKDILLLKTP